MLASALETRSAAMDRRAVYLKLPSHQVIREKHWRDLSSPARGLVSKGERSEKKEVTSTVCGGVLVGYLHIDRHGDRLLRRSVPA